MISTSQIRSATALALGILVLGTGVGCNQDDERYEVVNKLRAIGVAVDPFVTAPSPAGSPESATLTFYAAVPLDQTVTVDSFSDDASQFSKPLDINLVAGSETYEERGKFQIFSVQATTTIPAEDSVMIPTFPGYVTRRYGAALKSGDGEIENVVGNIVIFSKNKEELAWKDSPPSIKIDGLSDGQTVTGKVELRGEIIQSNGEKFKIGWFVSSGEVKNKRAVATTWEKMEKGPQTIILTARGKQTAAFAWTAVDVIVE